MRAVGPRTPRSWTAAVSACLAKPHGVQYVMRASLGKAIVRKESKGCCWSCSYRSTWTTGASLHKVVVGGCDVETFKPGAFTGWYSSLLLARQNKLNKFYQA